MTIIVQNCPAGARTECVHAGTSCTNNTKNIHFYIYFINLVIDTWNAENIALCEFL